MTIYQVIDDENHALYESESLESATQEAEILNLLHDERYFFVEPTDITVH